MGSSCASSCTGVNGSFASRRATARRARRPSPPRSRRRRTSLQPHRRTSTSRRRSRPRASSSASRSSLRSLRGTVGRCFACCRSRHQSPCFGRSERAWWAARDPARKSRRSRRRARSSSSVRLTSSCSPMRNNVRHRCCEGFVGELPVRAHAIRLVERDAEVREHATRSKRRSRSDGRALLRAGARRLHERRSRRRARPGPADRCASERRAYGRRAASCNRPKKRRKARVDAHRRRRRPSVQGRSAAWSTTAAGLSPAARAPGRRRAAAAGWRTNGGCGGTSHTTRQASSRSFDSRARSLAVPRIIPATTTIALCTSRPMPIVATTIGA